MSTATSRRRRIRQRKAKEKRRERRYIEKTAQRMEDMIAQSTPRWWWPSPT